MLRRLPVLLVPMALFVTGCATSPSQTSIPNGIAPLSTVTAEDARALDKKRQERRELARILLDRAEERSKTQQPSVWRPLGLPTEDETHGPSERSIEILRQPWTALQRALAPAVSPSSSTTPTSQ
jgi:hypothetical protein